MVSCLTENMEASAGEGEEVGKLQCKLHKLSPRYQAFITLCYLGLKYMIFWWSSDQMGSTNVYSRRVCVALRASQTIVM